MAFAQEIIYLNFRHLGTPIGTGPFSKNDSNNGSPDTRRSGAVCLGSDEPENVARHRVSAQHKIITPGAGTTARYESRTMTPAAR